jgi:hypothetical protein
LQILHISVPKFAFEYVSGLSVNVGVSVNDTTTMNFGAGLSVFKFVINQETGSFLIGLNLVALFFLYQIKKISKADQSHFTI